MPSRAGLHAMVCVLLMMLFGAIPFSMVISAPLCLMLFAFGMGRTAKVGAEENAEARGPPSEMPYLLVAYGSAMLLGSMLQCGFLFLAMGSHK